MQGHAHYTISDRQRALDELRQEIQGKPPRGPFEWSEDLSFKKVVPTEGDTDAVARFKMALKRDCRWATAGSCYVRAFGLSQAMRSVYDGARQLIDGGAK